MARRSLDEDLELWERGEIRLEDLDARHPGANARGLAELHERLVALGATPVPDVEQGWEELRGRLPSRDATAGGRRRAPRRLLVALAATLLVGGTAYASSPAFWNDRVADVRELVGPEAPPPPAPAGDEPVPQVRGPRDPGNPVTGGGESNDPDGDGPGNQDRGGPDHDGGGPGGDDDADPDPAPDPDPDEDTDGDDSSGGDDEPDGGGRGSGDDDGRDSSDDGSSGGDDEPDDYQPDD